MRPLRVLAAAAATVLLVLGIGAHADDAGGPDFSWMTLNGLSRVATEIEGFTPEIEGLGARRAAFEEHLARRLREAGVEVISPEDARTLPGAGQIHVRLLVNKDPHGLYFYGVKLLVRQKIPLGNPAGGFISQVIWSAGENGMMRFGEGTHALESLDRVLEGFVEAYRRENAGPAR